MDSTERWPVLRKDDAGLLDEIQATLGTRVQGDPYSSDGSFASGLASLPPGLRAMAATHWLDVSLALDSLTWHFGNFGEPALVAQTEEGLRELGLTELADVFSEAKTLMLPLIDQIGPELSPDEALARADLSERGKAVDHRAWDLGKTGADQSAIYDAWLRYARNHPERVFG